MAADSWTITDADRDLVYVTLLVAGATYDFQVAVRDLDLTSQVTALAGVRAAVTTFRQSIVTRETIPPKFASSVGYTEPF